MHPLMAATGCLDAPCEPRRADLPRPRRAAPRWALLAVLVTGVAVAAVAAGHSLHRLGAALSASPQGATATTPFDPRLVGRWVSDDGKRILVSASGAVWADADLLGRAQLDETSGTRLVFSGDGFRCDYALTFVDRDTTFWRLAARTSGTPCPAGRFTRPFMF